MKSEDTQRVLAEIYRTGYFTNHGPQAWELERALAERFAAAHAVIVSNESLAVVMALAGLGLKGRVALAANSPAFLRHALCIAGFECDPVAAAHNEQVGLALIPTSWSDLTAGSVDRIDPSGVRRLFYAHGSFPSSAGRTLAVTDSGTLLVGVLGDGGASPSTHCAFILCGDDALAEKYRNIRSSYGARKLVEVTATANGRVSEYQAGLALRFLQQRFPPRL